MLELIHEYIYLFHELGFLGVAAGYLMRSATCSVHAYWVISQASVKRGGGPLEHLEVHRVFLEAIACHLHMMGCCVTLLEKIITRKTFEFLMN